MSPYPRYRFALVVRRSWGCCTSYFHPCCSQNLTASSAVLKCRAALATCSNGSAVDVHPTKGFSHLGENSVRADQLQHGTQQCIFMKDCAHFPKGLASHLLLGVLKTDKTAESVGVSVTYRIFILQMMFVRSIADNLNCTLSTAKFKILVERSADNVHDPTSTKLK